MRKKVQKKVKKPRSKKIEGWLFPNKKIELMARLMSEKLGWEGTTGSPVGDTAIKSFNKGMDHAITIVEELL